MSNLGINFIAWPEMLAWPYLILNGWLPYKDIAIAHNPLLLLDLVLFFKIFGIGVFQLKIYTWVLVGLNICLTYFVANKFWDTNVHLRGKKNALFASIIYLLLAIVYEGNGLWFDLALTPFALLLYYFLRDKKYLYAGIIFALGFLTKQTFIYFAIPVLLSKINVKKFIIGATPVFIVFTLYLLNNNLISFYYNWAIKFGIFYLPHAEGQVLLPTMKQFIFSFFPFLIFIFNFNYLIFAFALFGALGVYPRFELFHFQPALPFLAIAISSFVFNYKNKIIKILVLLVLILHLAYGIWHQAGKNTRFYEPEVIKITQEIGKVNTSEIYVINYWDSIYALTNTFPATKPLIPYIPWYLDYQNSKELILSDLKIKMPEIIVLGGKDQVFPDVFKFIEKYYFCNLVDGSVELCYKNK